MHINLLHGIVDDWVPRQYTHRLYVSKEAFVSHLQKRTNPYATWNETGPKGDILTVDDSTRAGAAACLLARELGHEVIFFVNPFQIQSGKPYFFSMLDTIIDNRTNTSVYYFDTEFDLRKSNDVRRFRVFAKDRLMVLPDERQDELLLDISSVLGAAEQDPPSHSAPITISELLILHDAGVRIENHGWTHVEISSLNDPEFDEHVSLADRWIHDVGCNCPTLYAVPFGETDLSPTRRDIIKRDYVLARNDLPDGSVKTKCWNRHDITGELRENR